MKFLANLFYFSGVFAILMGLMTQRGSACFSGLLCCGLGYLCRKAHNKIEARNIVDVQKNIEKIQSKNSGKNK